MNLEVEEDAAIALNLSVLVERLEQFRQQEKRASGSTAAADQQQ